MNDITYQHGFGNHFCSEAINGALPAHQNSPQNPPFGLYPEQISGAAFTRRPRACNLHSWLYRTLPTCVHSPFKKYSHQPFSETEFIATPNQLRWQPLPIPDRQMDFIQGCMPWMQAGNIDSQMGGMIFLYHCNQSMDRTFFYSADGEWLIIPQLGTLLFKTECGDLLVEPGEIVIIPRGIRFQVTLQQETARGYIIENYGAPFSLPELGPIGANGLANPRDFCFPVAKFYDEAGNFKMLGKFHHHVWEADMAYHPLNVVAWHGNYAPYKYDLRTFNTINTVSFDHPDPSIFTVLTSQSDTEGVANIDFVIFPPRWMVAEHTFRPPYYHRNIMNEFMGLIYGSYDAKPDSFAPGGSSVHNCMSGHGPDAGAFLQAQKTPQKPIKLDQTMAFMFESRQVWQISSQALQHPCLDRNYFKGWLDLPKNFSHTR